MDHAYIEEHGLVERYHRGLLEPEEEARFEEHFVDCAECTEQLELARGFQKGLKAMVAEDAARVVAAQAVLQAGLFAWLARRARLAQWALAAAALLLAAGLPSLWLLSQGREQRQAEAARLETERRNAADLQRRLSESERRRAEERRELEGRIAAVPTPSLPETPRGLASPLVNTPVFLLTAVRGGEEKPASVDPGAGDALALAVDVGPDSGFASYRATILKADGSPVFQRAGLKPNALEALMITFPATFFAPGGYRLRIEGVRPDGSASEIGAYPFKVKGKD